MLRHRRRQWAAMDFLLQSYRKQKKWIRIRQLLLLLARVAIAVLLIAMLSGWTGGGKALQILGGTTTHHVVILDDSYSMGDSSPASGSAIVGSSADSRSSANAYGRSLGALSDLITRLAADDGNHQLTVMRASRAAMASRLGSQSGDAAADLSAQTITADARLAARVMATEVSTIQTDLSSALDLASDLVGNTPADSTFVYIASDFRARDWDSPERLVAALRKLPTSVNVRMIDCAGSPAANLAITDISPVQDVWVAGVPVVINVTVKNYSQSAATNVTLQSRVVQYGNQINAVDPTIPVSGAIQPLPTITIESLAPGQQITKTFQVFITQQGTHAIEVNLPEDALSIDNARCCVLPLSDAEKVLVIDGDLDSQGAYHVASVLDPGSQVRIGAVPEIKTPAYLRSASWESLAQYRAVYLIDLPEIPESAADALTQYVRRGGGLAWFLGKQVSEKRYNEVLLARDRRLLPGELRDPLPLPVGDENQADLRLGESAETLLAPLASIGEAALALVGVSDSWQMQLLDSKSNPPDGPPEKPPVGPPEKPLENRADAPEEPAGGEASTGDRRIRRVIDRRDGLPWVLQHNVGQGRVVTVLSGLDGTWTNWPGDPSFVVFMLQSNALLWSGAVPPTGRFVDESITRRFSQQQFTGDVAYVPASTTPPRLEIAMRASEADSGQQIASSLSPNASFYQVELDPKELALEDNGGQQWLRPGVAEWAATKIDGSIEVTPTVGVIRIGEGDLSRAEQAGITQALMPMEVKFVTSGVWSDQNKVAGTSALATFLLVLLAVFLAAEQALAYWASYHSAGAAR